MSDAAQPWSDEHPAPAPAPAKAADGAGASVLDGDWSEGLEGAIRAHGLPTPAHVTLGAAAPQPAPPRRSAEELVAEAAGRLPAEALRTEQASAVALFTLAPERSAPVLSEPSIQIAGFDAEVTSVKVHVDAGLAAAAPAETAAAPAAAHDEAGSIHVAPSAFEPAIHAEPASAPFEAPAEAHVAPAAEAPAPVEPAATVEPAPSAAAEAPFDAAPAGPVAAEAPVASVEQFLGEAAPAEAAPAAEPAPLPDNPLAEQVAIDIRRALAAEDPAHPHASRTPPDVWAALLQVSPQAAPTASAPVPDTTQAAYPAPGFVRSDEPAAEAPSAAPADLWAQSTAAAGPEVWAAAAPPENAWAAGPEAHAGPDWGAVEASPSDGWEPPLATPPHSPFSESTTLESQRAQASLDSEDDLPVAIPDPEPSPGRPAYLNGEPRVVVHTLAGRVKRGTLRSSDLGEAELRLKTPVGTEEKIAIGDVKAVFFMLSPGEQPPIQPGGRIRITLSDGRQLDGFRESEGPGGGVFIVPIDASRTNTRAIFVCGDAIQAVDHT